MFVDWLTTENEATLICDGCGRAAEPIERAVAIAIVQQVVDGFVGLKRADGAEGTDPFWKVADAAHRAASAMNAIDGQLRRLSILGGPARELGDRIPPLASCTARFPNSSLVESAARLGWTLKTLADVCWYHPSAIEGFCPAEMTWIALHRATHFLEDARLLAENGRALLADQRITDEEVRDR